MYRALCIVIHLNTMKNPKFSIQNHCHFNLKCSSEFALVIFYSTNQSLSSDALCSADYRQYLKKLT